MKRILIGAAVALVVILALAARNNGSGQLQPTPAQSYNSACLDNAASGCALVR